MLFGWRVFEHRNGYQRMLKARHAVLGVAILFALLGDSWGRSRQQLQPQPQPPNGQQQTPTDQRGTDQSPFIVKIIPTPDSPEEAKHKTQQEDDKSRADWWLVKLTGILALIGFLQLVVFGWVFGWQGIQLRNSVKASRDEFLATHRPAIRIKHVVLRNDIWQEEPIVIDVTCVNKGISAAALQHIGITYFVARKGRPLPIQPAIPAVREYRGARLEVGINYPFENININRILTAQENADIQQERSELYCVGWVSYLDGANRMRITGFCRVLRLPPLEVPRTIENCRFRRVRDPDYEYED
jgi:hypothetical protein